MSILVGAAARCCARGTYRSRYGSSWGEIILDNVRCSGDESSLFDCSHNGLNIHNCIHSEDVEVTCQGENKIYDNIMLCMLWKIEESILVVDII